MFTTILKNSFHKKMETKELIAFECKHCKQRVDIGHCGDHREKTGHKEFESIYHEEIINNKEKISY
jgi:uncharacterized protein YlaI